MSGEVKAVSLCFFFFFNKKIVRIYLKLFKIKLLKFEKIKVEKKQKNFLFLEKMWYNLMYAQTFLKLNKLRD